MRAARVTTLDGPASIEVTDLPEPTPIEGLVTIDVHFAGVTFPDVLLTRGQYQIRPDLPFTPGSEVSGIVRCAPAGSGFAPGDRVAAFPGSAGSRRWSTPTRVWSSHCPTRSASTPQRDCR